MPICRDELLTNTVNGLLKTAANELGRGLVWTVHGARSCLDFSWGAVLLGPFLWACSF